MRLVYEACWIMLEYKMLGYSVSPLLSQFPFTVDNYNID